LQRWSVLCGHSKDLAAQKLRALRYRDFCTALMEKLVNRKTMCMPFAYWRESMAEVKRRKQGQKGDKALQVALLKWSGAQQQVTSQTYFRTWMKDWRDARDERIRRGMAAHEVAEDHLTNRAMKCVEALGRERCSGTQRHLFVRWHGVAMGSAYATAAYNKKTEDHLKAMEQQMSSMLVAADQHAGEAERAHKALKDSTEMMHEQNKNHTAAMEEMEKEMEHIQEQCHQLQLHCTASQGMATESDNLREQCRIQAEQLEELERELEMLHAHVVGAGMAPKPIASPAA